MIYLPVILGLNYLKIYVSDTLFLLQLNIFLLKILSVMYAG